MRQPVVIECVELRAIDTEIAQDCDWIDMDEDVEDLGILGENGMREVSMRDNHDAATAAGEG